MIAEKLTMKHCPRCGKEIGEVVDVEGQPALKVGALLFRQRFRAYCAVCRKPQHFKPGREK